MVKIGPKEPADQTEARDAFHRRIEIVLAVADLLTYATDESLEPSTVTAIGSFFIEELTTLRQLVEVLYSYTTDTGNP
jgi:hypothetical protein